MPRGVDFELREIYLDETDTVRQGELLEQNK